MHAHDEPYTEVDDVAADEFCSCEHPVPSVRGEQKGMGRTYCDRCGQPVRLAWR